MSSTIQTPAMQTPSGSRFVAAYSAEGVVGLTRMRASPKEFGLWRDLRTRICGLPISRPRKCTPPACVHRHKARPRPAEERQHLIPPRLLAQDRSPHGVSPVDLKHILRQIESERDNLRRDRSPLWIRADPPWHTDAVGGGYIVRAGQAPSSRRASFRKAGSQGAAAKPQT